MSTNSPLLDQRLSRWLILFALAVLIVLHWPSLNGLFTSDTLSILRSCASKSEQAELWPWILSRFWHGLEVSSHYYRPLSSASLCLDYSLYGTEPLGWRLTQLTFHLMNGGLLYWLALNLGKDLPWRHSAAAVTPLFFWLSPASPEVSLWIAGRYDAMAMSLMLLTLIAHSQQRRWLAALAMALALSAKESAMILPALVASMSWWRHTLDDQTSPLLRSRLASAFHELWPMALVFIAYLSLRQFIFGNPFTVYPNSDGLLQDMSWQWFNRIPLLAGTLLPAWRENTPATTFFWSILGAAVVASAWLARRQQRSLRLWLLPAFWIAVSVFALLPHLKQLSIAGQGSRLLYSASAWFALLLTLPLAGICWSRGKAVITATLLAGIAITLGWAQHPAQRDWTFASHYTRTLIHNIAQQAEQIPEQEWALLLVPDHLGVALIARNAQGALVLPPMQPEWYLDRIIPFIPDDLNLWFERIEDGHPRQYKAPHIPMAPWPDRYYCADPRSAELIELKLPPISANRQQWRHHWRTALNASACATAYELITRQTIAPG